MKATASITRADWTRRRRMNTSMRRSLHRNEAQRKEVVRQLDQFDIVAHRPHDRLLVQRNMPELFLMDAQGLVDHVGPLGGVEFSPDRFDQLIDTGVRVAADIEYAMGCRPA